MGVGLALTGEVWHTAAAREREAELLYVGHQYRKAIERYYLSGPRQYPRTLEDLLKDPRKPGTERYLRRLYPDPLTGKDEWGIVKGPDGGVMGVYSLSEEQPLKSANFRLRDREFEGHREVRRLEVRLRTRGAVPGRRETRTRDSHHSGWNAHHHALGTHRARDAHPVRLTRRDHSVRLTAAPTPSGSPAPTPFGSPAPTPSGSPTAPTPFNSPTAPTSPAMR